MSTLNITLDAAGVTGDFYLPPGGTATYTATPGETFAGRIFFERAQGDGAWKVLAEELDDGFTGSLHNETRKPQRFRYRLEAEDGETPIADDINCLVIDTVGVMAEVRNDRGDLVGSLSDDGKVILASTAAILLGEPGVIGTYQFVRSGDDLLIQRWEGETPDWVTKSTIAAAP